jgi:hypothetical protein
MTGDIVFDAPVVARSALVSWTARLDSVVYRIRIAWNARTYRWSMDVIAADGTLLAGGVGINADVSILGAFNDSRLPAGQFAALTVGAPSEIGRDAFRTTHRFVYRPAALVSAAEGTGDALP